MFPYADDTQSYSFPVWVVILIALNVFIYFGSISGNDYLETLFAYGCIPARFFASQGEEIDVDVDLPADLLSEFQLHFDQSDWAPPFMTLFTSMFLHGGFFHLLGNMWFLWLFGDNIEDRMGKLVFPIFYLLSGLFANLLHILFFSDSVTPAIGASGAIAGVMGAYIYLFPRATIATLTGYFLYFFTLHIPATIYLGVWFLFQLLGGFAESSVSNIAFFAHIGGFIAGVILAILLDMTRMITKYPGDRGYSARIPRAFVPSEFTPRTRKRYIWRDY